MAECPDIKGCNESGCKGCADGPRRDPPLTPEERKAAVERIARSGCPCEHCTEHQTLLARLLLLHDKLVEETWREGKRADEAHALLNDMLDNPKLPAGFWEDQIRAQVTDATQGRSDNRELLEYPCNCQYCQRDWVGELRSLQNDLSEALEAIAQLRSGLDALADWASPDSKDLGDQGLLDTIRRTMEDERADLKRTKRELRDVLDAAGISADVEEGRDPVDAARSLRLDLNAATDEATELRARFAGPRCEVCGNLCIDLAKDEHGLCPSCSSAPGLRTRP